MASKPSSRRPAAVRIQSRLSIDPDMGEIYDWLIGLSPVVRGRELLHAARLGRAVLRGQTMVIPVLAGANAATPENRRPVQSELALSEPQEPSEPIDPVRQAEQADLQVLVGWSLEGMLPPPPPLTELSS